jgi:NAD(P)-dependent dehydrogenase (short-subunit alcohol dehydrogenase family)
MGERCAFVTGGAARLGKAVAVDLARMGYHVVLHYNRSVEKAIETKSEIEKLGAGCTLLQFDFMADNDFDSIFESLKDKGLDIEVLVNSASEFVPSSFGDVGGQMLQRQMRINFESAYLLTKSFAKMCSNGVVINFIDTKTTKNRTSYLDYLLAKKLLKEFTLLAAVHLSPRLRVNAIAPGLVLPPEGKDESYLNNLAREVPLQRHGGVDDILKALRFLLESQFVTGQIIYVDGGEHLI